MARKRQVRPVSVRLAEAKEALERLELKVRIEELKAKSKPRKKRGR